MAVDKDIALIFQVLLDDGNRIIILILNFICVTLLSFQTRRRIKRTRTIITHTQGASHLSYFTPHLHYVVSWPLISSLKCPLSISYVWPYFHSGSTLFSLLYTVFFGVFRFNSESVHMHNLGRIYIGKNA